MIVVNDLPEDYATLDDSSLVEQNPASATVTPGANKIPLSNSSGKIDNGWLETGSGNGLDADLFDGHQWSEVEDGLNGVTNSLNDVIQNVDTLNTEVTNLTTEVNGLTTEVNGLNTEVNTLNTEVDGKSPLHGFTYPYDANLTYDSATRTITVSPVVSSFSFWMNGVKFVKNAAETSAAHSSTSGQYFFTYDNLGHLQVSTTGFNLQDLASIPVCVVYYNATLGQGFANYELHKAERNIYAHRQAHFAIGTFIKTPAS